MNRLAFSLTILALVLPTTRCGTTTEPENCTTTTVFAGESFYLDRGEAEQTFSGMLERRNTPATPNGRDHRYFLNGTPVYSGGLTTEPKFEAARGARITIRGKTVDVGFGPEIWAASLTACR